MQREVNDAAWGNARLVAEYANRTLRPPESVILSRYRDPLARRVLELGCGAGRITGHLLAISDDVHGIDVMPEMVAYCRATYTDGDFEVGDLRDLSRVATGSYDAVVAGFNVLDVLDDEERRRALAEVARVLAPDGLLVMSSHNLAAAGTITPPTRVLASSLRGTLGNVRHLPARLRNHRRLRPYERAGDGWAIRNDQAHDYGLLHYYVARDTQEVQLKEAGFDLLDCLDLDGTSVGSGEQAAHCTELHYVARRT